MTWTFRHRHARLGCIAALASALIAAAPAPPGDLGDWIGRYPTDDDARPPRKLLAVPAIQAQLHILLDAQDLDRLKRFTVEEPIEQVAGLLVVQLCLPHDCGDQNAMLVIDPTRRRMWAGFFSRSSGVVTTRWFGATDHQDLPPPVLGKFLSEHRP